MAKPDLELEEMDQRFTEVERMIQSACEIMGKLKGISPKIEKIHKMSSEIHEIKNKTMQALKPVKVRLEGLADSHNQAAEMLEELRQGLEELQEEKESIWVELAECAPLTRVSDVEEQLETIATGQKQAEKSLESMKLQLRELGKAKELIWTELSKCVSSTRQSEFLEQLETILTGQKQAEKSLEGLKLQLRELGEAKELIWKELSKCVSSVRQSDFEEKMEAKAADLERNASEQNDRLCTAVAKLSEILEKQDDRIKSITQEASKNAKNIRIVFRLGFLALLLSAAGLFLGR